MAATHAGRMRAWIVDSPGPIDRRPLRAVTREPRSPSPGEVRVKVAACGVCRTDLHLAEGDLRRAATASCRATRSSASSTRSAPVRAGSRSGDRVGDRLAPRHLRPLPVLPQRAGEPVPRRGVHRLGRRRRLRRVRRGARGLRLPRFPTALDDAPPPRCCAPGSSATARSGAPSCRRAAGSASTGSARRPTSSPRSRSPRGRPCTSSPALPRPAELALDLGAASAGPADARHPNRSTPPSCSPRRASSSRSRMRALDRGGTLAVAGHPPQRHPGSNYLRRHCSTRSSCAASPPTPGPTARSSFGWLPGCASGRRRRRAPWPRPTRRWPTWPPTGSPAPPCSFPDRPSSARTALASAGSPRSATRASPATAPVNRGVQGPDPKGRVGCCGGSRAEGSVVPTLSPDSRRTT